ncbi:MAG: hypothetical protein GKR90_01375 [Pseudomonadales bacterium]|nr:hypothetical protein [Pseudomonadales bacterium]
MLRTILRSMSIVLVLSCAVPTAADQLDGESTSEKSSNVTEPAYMRIEECVLAKQIKTIEAISTRLLLLKGRKQDYWLNRLPKECRGLQKDMSISYSRRGSRVCAHTRFEARHRSSELDIGASASCSFGRFERVSVEQVTMLRRSQQ